MSEPPDIIVIGGGVIGLTCAWRLAQRGARVVVLERHECGSGATAASLGALIPMSPARRTPIAAIDRESLQSYPHFAAELHDATGVDVEYQRRGRIEILQSEQRRRLAEREVEAACEIWPEPDGRKAMELLDEHQAANLFAQITRSEFGALHCRMSAQVSVQALVRALETACQRAGVDVREGCLVQGLDIQNDRIHGVFAERETLACVRVLVTAGAWSPLLHPALRRHAPIAPVRGQALLLTTGSVRFEPLVRSRGTYLIRRRDGHVQVGATTEPDAGFDEQPTLAGAAQLTGGALELMPALARAALLRVWAGLRPRGADGRPYLGAIPGVQGLYVAAGHYKLGVGLAPLTGRLMTELLLDGRTSIDLSPFAPGRGIA